MAPGTPLGAASSSDHQRAFPRRVVSCLVLGLLTMTLAPVTPRSLPEAPPTAPAQLTIPGPTPGGVPLTGAQTPALEPDGDPEGDGPGEGDDSGGASGTDLVWSGTAEPAGARARAVSLKFVTFVHVLRGQARATPAAGTRAPPLI